MIRVSTCLILIVALWLGAPAGIGFAALAGLVPESVPPPKISPNLMGYTQDTVEVTITGQGELYYTDDGSIPTSNAKRYTGPFTVSGDKVIKAIAVEGGQQSGVVTEVFFAKKPRGNPEFPAWVIPDMPPLYPSIITTDGRRMLLGQTDVEVSYDEAQNLLSANRENIWIMNYPFKKIRGFEGLSREQIAERIFGVSWPVKNWYLYVPGSGAYNPPDPEGVMPIEPHPNPDTVVQSGQSLQGALSGAACGDVVHVSSGTYDERITMGQMCTSDNPLIVEGIRDAAGNMPKITNSKGNDMVAIDGENIHFRGFEITSSGQTNYRGLVKVTGGGNVFEFNYLHDNNRRGVSISFPGHTMQSQPSYVRGNWFIRPGWTGIGIHHDLWEGGRAAHKAAIREEPHYTTKEKAPFYLEYNYIKDSNKEGYNVFTESGGAKILNAARITFRYNTVIGDKGPGIWYDWENWQNRTEGNYFFHNNWYAVGTEASPGPHYIANNLVVELGPGSKWFSYAFLEWSSNAIIVINNTVDKSRGSDGMYVGEGPEDRGTVWGSMAPRRHVAFNNIWRNTAGIRVRNVANFQEGNNFKSMEASAWQDQPNNNYQLADGSAAADKGVVNPYSAVTPYDFYGLLRFDEDGTRAAGAMRNPVEIPSGTRNVLEVEFENGVKKRYLLDGTGGNVRTDTADGGTTGTTATGPCHQITNANPQVVPSGFGMPFNVLSQSQELLVSVACTRTGAELAVGVGHNLQYLYQFAYVWRGGSWQRLQLSGANKVGGAWFVGRAQTRLPHTSAELSQNNFVVAYVCTWQNTQWKCGCRDRACSQSFWQLQIFRGQ